MSHWAFTLFTCFWKQIIRKEGCLSWKDDISWSHVGATFVIVYDKGKQNRSLGDCPHKKGNALTIARFLASVLPLLQWQQLLLLLLSAVALDFIIGRGGSCPCCCWQRHRLCCLDIRFAVWEASRYQGTFWHAICVNVNVKFSGGRWQAVLPVRMTSTWKLCILLCTW